MRSRVHRWSFAARSFVLAYVIVTLLALLAATWPPMSWAHGLPSRQPSLEPVPWPGASTGAWPSAADSRSLPA